MGQIIVFIGVGDPLAQGGVRLVTTNLPQLGLEEDVFLERDKSGIWIDVLAVYPHRQVKYDHSVLKWQVIKTISIFLETIILIMIM